MFCVSCVPTIYVSGRLYWPTPQRTVTKNKESIIEVWCGRRQILDQKYGQCFLPIQNWQPFWSRVSILTLLSVTPKVFATVLLNKVRDQLLAHRRTEQSGFTPGRSTIDRIVTLSTVIQSRKEFQRPIWIAFVDLKAAFDSVDHKALWKLLRSLGLHSKVVDLMEALYTNTCSCVCADGVLSDWFAVVASGRAVEWCLTCS